MGIENIHAVRASWSKLRQLVLHHPESVLAKGTPLHQAQVVHNAHHSSVTDDAAPPPSSPSITDGFLASIGMSAKKKRVGGYCSEGVEQEHRAAASLVDSFVLGSDTDNAHPTTTTTTAGARAATTAGACAAALAQSSFNGLLHSSHWCANWLSSVEGTGWLQHIRSILRGAHATATTIAVHAVPVLVHCSDGWDRTAQIVSLTQVLLDAHCRSIDGFLSLIDREWCAFGHCFRTRVGHGIRDSDRSAVQQSSPIFVQFLDCVFQIVRLQASAFEFTSKLLLLIADAVHDCRFGNFMHDSERARAAAAVEERTPSLWVYVRANREELGLVNHGWEGEADETVQRHQTASPPPPSSSPVPATHVNLLQRLCPSALLRSVVLWDEYFVRYSTLPSSVPQVRHTQPPSCESIGIAVTSNQLIHRTAEKHKEQQEEEDVAHEELRCQNAELLRQVSELRGQLSEIQAQSLVLPPPPPTSSAGGEDTPRSRGRKRPAEIDLQQQETGGDDGNEGSAEAGTRGRVGTPRKKLRKETPRRVVKEVEV
jgi:hypothetical protein